MSSTQLRRWFASPYFPHYDLVARVLNVMILSFMAVSASAWFIGTVLLSGTGHGFIWHGQHWLFDHVNRAATRSRSRHQQSVDRFDFAVWLHWQHPRRATFSIGVVASMVAVFAASVIFNREQVIKVILANTLIAVVGYVYWAFITSKPTNQIYLILYAFLYAGYSFAVVSLRWSPSPN